MHSAAMDQDDRWARKAVRRNKVLNVNMSDGIVSLRIELIAASPRKLDLTDFAPVQAMNVAADGVSAKVAQVEAHP